MEASITFKSVAKKIKDETILAELTFGVEKNTNFAPFQDKKVQNITLLTQFFAFVKLGIFTHLKNRVTAKKTRVKLNNSGLKCVK